MSDFLQLHVLTAYPPSNPNRDDLGRPKSAVIGGRMRQRISSQSIKRALRMSDVFSRALEGRKGERTQRLGDEIVSHLLAKGAKEDRARAIAQEIASAFGKLEDDKDKGKSKAVRIKQLAFISPDERQLSMALAEKVLAGEEPPKEKELVKALLRKADGAVDIAMFGRMLADNPDFNRDAAVQVAHAFTTNAVEIEDDFYTAVDDLKTPDEDAGAGFVGEAGFGAGVYYLYICVDRELLVRNLAGDAALAARGLDALARAIATASPSGKRNSFANHVRPELILAERGDRQPRSLASAFTRPIGAGDEMNESVERLMRQRKNFADAYGKDWAEEITLRVGAQGSATLDQVAAFAAAGLRGASK
jgi:CRISPR system Cascade subunit CasC